MVGQDYENMISDISIAEFGDIHFTLIGGEKRVWKNMLLNTANHTHTVIGVFLGKVICGKCGTNYHRVNAHNRWCYWKCYGKQKHICDNVNYTDYHLRIISAYIMESDEFDDDALARQIDHIEVTENGNLVYHYKDERIKEWHRM